MRVALYWSPERDDRLLEAGNTWLGRDPESGSALEQPQARGIVAATAAPRLYGFHATLRPPMRLATGCDAFVASACALAAETAPFDLPTLIVGQADGCLALHLAAACPALDALASACVAATEAHRAPPDLAELARRRQAGLTARQEALLQRWGYPYVMEEWRFHMTLTGRLQPGAMAAIGTAAEAHFDESASLPRRVSSLSLFVQSETGAPLRLTRRLKLGGAATG